MKRMAGEEDGLFAGGGEEDLMKKKRIRSLEKMDEADWFTGEY